MNAGRARFVPWAIFAIAPFLIFSRAMIGAGMMDGGDDQVSNLPLLLHSGRALLRFDLLWTNDLWMGMPLLAEPEAAMFYPPRLLLLLFSPAAAYGAYILLHFVIAECTAYVYLRALDLSRPSATFGAIAYAFSGFMLGHIGHTMYVVAGAWSPLFLFFLHRAWRGVGRPRLTYLGAALAFAAVLFGGAVQLAAYLLAMSGILHAAFAIFTRSTRPIRVWVLAAVPALLIVSLQLLPSFEHARALSVATRHDYAFATELSWHPLLLPTLIMPLSPAGNAELYSRCGAVVLCAAALAVGTRARLDPIVRAWSVVGFIALLLMLGRFVPPLAHALHALPFVDVLRGPVRHNFELGTAVAFLAAFGAEALMRARPAKLWPAALGVVLFGSICVFVFRIARRTVVPATEQIRYASISELRLSAIVCAFALLGFLVIRMLATRPNAGTWAVGGMLVLTMGESRISESFQSEAFWDEIRREAIPRRDIGLPEGEHVRLIPPHVDESSIDALPGDAVLYREGVQHLYGYGSIAPRDAAALFDLDMHGHAQHRDDLIWSRLPSLFGVTHMIMPRVTCGTPAFTIDATSPSGEADCSASTPASFTVGKEPRRCNVTFGDGRQRYRVDAEIRSVGARTKAVIFGIWPFDPYAHGGLVIVPPTELATTFRPFGAWLDLPARLSAGWLGVYTKDTVGADVRALRLRSETLEVVASIEPGLEVTVHGSVRDDGARLDLSPHGGELAQIDRTFTWPRWLDWQMLPAMRLEALARRGVGPVPEKLVIDLYGGSSFDLAEAQLVTSGDRLCASPSPFCALGTDLLLGAAPPQVSLRAFANGEGTIELTRARLLAGRIAPLASVHEGGGGQNGAEYRLSGDTIHLQSMGSAATIVYFSYRPITLDLELGPDASSTSSAGIGLAATGARYDEQNELVIAASAVKPGRRFTRTIALRADTRTATLRTYTEGDAAVTIQSLRAHDACLDHRYEPVKEIEGGLWLYRNLDAMPRMFTVSKVIAVSDFAAAAELVRESTSFDPRNAAVVETDGATPLPRDLAVGSITAGRIEAQRVEATIDAPDGPTFLVVNEHFDPRWQVTIDGVPASILRTNALVRGVIVPRGHHQVAMRYVASAAVWAGAVLALLGIALAAWGAPWLHARWVGSVS